MCDVTRNHGCKHEKYITRCCLRQSGALVKRLLLNADFNFTSLRFFLLHLKSISLQLTDVNGILGDRQCADV